MKVAIIGSRSVTMRSYEILCEKIPIGASLILSGGAQGADQLAKYYAEQNNLPYQEFLPDYKTFGRNAPLKRNESMIDHADYVLALWDGRSRGTAYGINYCIQSYTPVKVLIRHDYRTAKPACQ